jgi:hypothetical protein
MLTATVDATKTPPTLTVVSNKRAISVTVASAGDTVTVTGAYPITITDAVHTWTKSTDDGTTAVYNLAS